MNTESIAPAIKKASPWLIIWSTVTFVCGILAIILPLTISFGNRAHHRLLGFGRRNWTFVFAFEMRSVGGFLWQILVSLLYAMAAICLVLNPLFGVLSLSLFLAIFLLLDGILEFARAAGPIRSTYPNKT